MIQVPHPRSLPAVIKIRKQRPASRRPSALTDGTTDIGDFQYVIFNLVTAVYFVAEFVRPKARKAFRSSLTRFWA